MMASWKPEPVVKHCLKLQTYFINCCVVTIFNKEICIRNQFHEVPLIVKNLYATAQMGMMSP
jgi:hypothetical protein